MAIYQPKPYVYKGIHTVTGQYYFGYRAANRYPASEDLGIKYFTSSRTVKDIGFFEFDWMILKEFESAVAAFRYENEMIKTHIHDVQCLNRHYIDVLGNKHFPKFVRAGKKDSEETRSKKSKASSGRRHSPSTIKAMKLAASKSWNSLRKIERTTKAEQSRTKRQEELEQFELAFIGPRLPKYHREPEKRQAQRELMTRINKSRIGKPLSEEHKKTLSKSIKGKPQRKRTEAEKLVSSQRNSKPISVDGEVYDFTIQAAAATGISRTKLAKMANDPDCLNVFFLPK